LLTFIIKIKEIIARWWSEFTLQTKLMAAATLVVSLIMSSLTFWAVNTIQLQSNINDTRFGSDLSILIASNAAPLVISRLVFIAVPLVFATSSMLISRGVSFLAFPIPKQKSRIL
jgi:hypothetical protein